MFGPTNNNAIINDISHVLVGVLGYGVTARQNHGGDFYDESYVLGDCFGFVRIGGNAGSILVILHGTGCMAAKDGWQNRLHAWLATCVCPVITRVDLACDDLAGELITPRSADILHTKGGFTMSGKTPKCERLGDWKNENGKGITIYIGNRQNGKFCRIYEKGKQLGDPLSPWVRIEVEFKNRDRVIPIDVLLDAASYFFGAYPCFLSVFSGFSENVELKKIATKKKITKITLERAVYETSRCYGKYLHIFRRLYGDEKTMDILSLPDWPRRLAKLDHRFAEKNFDSGSWLAEQLNDHPDCADAGV
jgi:phage replication initiation protein